jgi:hypothetical protein
MKKTMKFIGNEISSLLHLKNHIKYIFKKIENLFLWSSGADMTILNQVPMEKTKYFGIGGTIVFTALMASFAGGYAFFTAFKSPFLAIPFGLFWGLLIFNLDRYIVASFGVGDGKKTISKQELIEAAPRLAMAIILGFVISTPLELKLFEKEINAKISTDIAIVQNTIINSSSTDPKLISLNSERTQLVTSIKKREEIIENKRLFWEKSNKDKNDEWNTGKFSGKTGKGGYYDDLKKVADDAEIDYNKTKINYSALNDLDYRKTDIIDTKIDKRDAELRIEIENQTTVQSQNDGLLARLKALGDLTSENTTLLFSKWLITILFIFIEIAPILFKMMTERGPYDDIVDRKKHEYKVRQLELQSNINQEINTAVRIHTDKYEQKLNAELQSNKEILEVIAKAQQEIAIVAIEKWKEEQKELMNKNGSVIISSSN